MSNHVPSLKHKLDEALKEIQRLKGSPKVQEQLNMANKTVAELMEQNALLKTDNERLISQYHLLVKQSEELPLKLQAEINRLTGETYYNKGDKEIIIRDLQAENHALKSELQRLTEMYEMQVKLVTVNETQQPLVVNHYHNCTINK